ncbi:IclR family transcriptional regulator C-terminal domain-containing protein [Bradyrhizobium sp. SBR1B]|nr:IclR family transcriptional regulator C-terminal domain-containing protein [Bradyrhizobium sp. SBR1B]MBB4378548.1 DNA-binding IclR family transcriptional regulator [Bradyrhizobium sp. SBR1B]
MELTSLGRAYLAGIAEAERERLLRQFKRRSAAATKALLADVRASIRSVERNGYCAVSWQPGVLAVATPIVLAGLPVYALNMSLQNVERSDALAGELGAYLNAFAAKCKEVLAGQ